MLKAGLVFVILVTDYPVPVLCSPFFGPADLGMAENRFFFDCRFELGPGQAAVEVNVSPPRGYRKERFSVAHETTNRFLADLVSVNSSILVHIEILHE